MNKRCNEANCTCPSTGCERHGKCCECINFHRKRGSLVMCLRDLKKPDKRADAAKS